MRCCLQTQTEVAAIICFFLIGISAGIEMSTGSYQLYGSGFDYAPPETKIPGYAICMVSDVLCLIGAYKYKKYLLMPFIVKTGLCILVLVFYLISIQLIQSIVFDDMDNSLITNLMVITLLYFMLGLFTYFLVCAVKFFQEISSVTSGTSKTMVLQPNIITDQLQINPQPNNYNAILEETWK